jgi:hypothetical protein
LTRDLVSPDRRAASRHREAGDDALAATVSPTGEVLAGPFVGLQFPFGASWGGFAARLAGCYEQEIQSHVQAAIDASPPVVIDAGAAEGYYAVGFARRLRAAQVISFDIDPVARRACREVARLNGVSNLVVRGRITPKEMNRHLRPDSLVLSDVEGYERELLEPRSAPGLQSCRIICELHEFAAPGVTDTITSRFASTHRVELVTAEPRREVPRYLAHLEAQTARQAIREGRPPGMQWAVMIPR